jgi:hypothetical protein
VGETQREAPGLFAAGVRQRNINLASKAVLSAQDGGAMSDEEEAGTGRHEMGGWRSAGSMGRIVLQAFLGFLATSG